MSDPWTAAWEEAEATAPPEVMIYATLELRHPAFVDEVEGPFAVRAVAGSADDISFTLEVGAPLNGGETVVFQAVPFMAERPTYEEGKTPETKVIVDNIGQEMMPYLELAVLMRADMEATYREYRSDDLSGPCYGPINFVIKRVKATNTRIEGLAYIDDLANRKFPNKVYTLRDFPGLLP
jgi:hypothetical protein